MKKITISLIILLSLSAAVKATAQGTDLGATPFLTIPAGARSASMAFTGSALDQGAFSVFHNPAATVFSDRSIGAGYSFSRWTHDKETGDNTFMHSVAAYYKINNKNSISLGFRFFKQPEFGTTDVSGVFNGFANPKDLAVDLAYSRYIVEGLSASVTARLVHSDLDIPDTDKANAVGFDIGLYYNRRIAGFNGGKWAVGLSVTNIGTEIDYGVGGYKMPGTIKAGGSATLPFTPDHILTGALDLRYQMIPSDASLFEGGFGLEYNLFRYAFIRGGYHFGSKDKGYGNFATVGIGVDIISYARLDFSYFIADEDSALRNTFGLSLGLYF